MHTAIYVHRHYVTWQPSNANGETENMHDVEFSRSFSSDGLDKRKYHKLAVTLLRFSGFLGFCPSSGLLINAMFRKLDLFPTLDEGNGGILDP
jgi:hypothetical protein